MKSSVNVKRLGAAAVLAVTLAAGCGAHLQNTSGSPSRGSPPLCFQYRGEARPSPFPNASNIWLMANNTCSFPVSCNAWDDVTEQEHGIAVAPNSTGSYLVASGAATNRVTFKLDCTWTR